MRFVFWDRRFDVFDTLVIYSERNVMLYLFRTCSMRVYTCAANWWNKSECETKDVENPIGLAI